MSHLAYERFHIFVQKISFFFIDWFFATLVLWIVDYLHFFVFLVFFAEGILTLSVVDPVESVLNKEANLECKIKDTDKALKQVVWWVYYCPSTLDTKTLSSFVCLLEFFLQSYLACPSDSHIFSFVAHFSCTKIVWE